MPLDNTPFIEGSHERVFVKAKPASLCCQPGGLALSASVALGLVSAGSGQGMIAIVRFFSHVSTS